MLTDPKLCSQVDALRYKFWTGGRANRSYILRAVQSVFLQKRHLITADLYEPPLDSFGADAVERWFTEKEIFEIVTFSNQLAA